jgi:hypothetical protein
MKCGVILILSSKGLLLERRVTKAVYEIRDPCGLRDKSWMGTTNLSPSSKDPE